MTDVSKSKPPVDEKIEPERRKGVSIIERWASDKGFRIISVPNIKGSSKPAKESSTP
jgi:hypothetical protein